MTTGFPPDIAHGLFEGIIPVEVALCLAVFVGKKIFYIEQPELSNPNISLQVEW